MTAAEELRNAVMSYVESELTRLESEHLLRKQHVFSTPQLPVSLVDGRRMLLFSSSNYLSFGEKKWKMPAWENLGAGSGGSRLTTGNSTAHERLEEKLRSFFGVPSAVLFSTGYTANVGVLSALGRKAEIFSDEKNHASIIDGCRLARAKVTIYRHADMEDLETKLRASAAVQKILVSDGVFSMDGDILNLPAFLVLAKKYRAFTIVDDAHGLGVIGRTGKGIVEHFGASAQPDILIGTLSKAMGSEGGFALSSSAVGTYLRNQARSYIFSTSLSPYCVTRAYEAFCAMEKSTAAHDKLVKNIRYMQAGLKKCGLPVGAETAILPVPIGSEEKAMEIAAALWAKGFYLTPIRFPAVAHGKAILRLTLMADHTKEQLDALLSALSHALRFRKKGICL